MRKKLLMTSLKMKINCGLREVVNLHSELELESICKLSWQHKALLDIKRCRTEYYGGSEYHCESCKRDCSILLSCRNRHCPQCGYRDTEEWIEARKTELIDCRYFHLVFTVPASLRNPCLLNQRKAYGAIMKAASESILLLCRDSHYMGGKPAILSIMHTWNRQGDHHPHVHCLVSSVGETPEGDVVKARRDDWLIPINALSKIFRAKVRDSFKELQINALAENWQIKWNVFAKASVQGREKVLHYLARYVFKTAISNSNIISIDSAERVKYKYLTNKGELKTVLKPSTEFIERFIKHILPPGFTRVRYSGLWAPSNRKKLKRIQYTCLPEDSSKKSIKVIELNSMPTALKCPHCKKSELIFVRIISAMKARSPPK